MQTSFNCLVSELHHDMQALGLPPKKLLPTLSQLTAFLGRPTDSFLYVQALRDEIDSLKCLEKQSLGYHFEKDKSEKP